MTMARSLCRLISPASWKAIVSTTSTQHPIIQQRMGWLSDLCKSSNVPCKHTHHQCWPPRQLTSSSCHAASSRIHQPTKLQSNCSLVVSSAPAWTWFDQDKLPSHPTSTKPDHYVDSRWRGNPSQRLSQHE